MNVPDNRDFQITFASLASIEDGWTIPGGYDIKCPVCDFNYVHVDKPEHYMNDDYRAWTGRGELIRIPFSCEQGHAFSLCFGFHKGNVISFWEHSR